ncbi:hypothetical protein AMP1_11 [Burkholderia phage AMP1]|uniref:Uncharacterized protein n=5 Tax=Ampunavirus BpAMP1 TaxID=2733589 RepID=A0A5C2IBK5_9CAUD|nr:hypothetical protein HOQ94_gp14 [Burkholderia phage Bp-AMP1]QEP52838.1 hypothetical protein AMP1_11 [Burkholderia phage AMP1]CDL65169.1 hypothetical protein [Burkholderia phage Bp-AMP2]CDL65209.1 hypothetical protein [Burkholderia phage Bp-AMP3]CDL65261.1 hypothetical protein [Burkholderia phage Bp-AMP4]CDK30083.1 hypothetical protein [Burkholderia phage Bp-AMP1]
MRQQFRTNLPEQDDLHPLSVQLKDDKWHVFDASTGGWSKEGFESYKGADALAREIKHQQKVNAAARVLELAQAKEQA